jgi:bifunctional DNA-binding transcriptional regulator/antitoxin component of YhaV-PrlF toxin-antitoxin module
MSVGGNGGPRSDGSGFHGVDELVIQSLALPKREGVGNRRRIGKFDLGELHVLVDNGELDFAFGLVDDRGRVSNRPILNHLGWDPRTSLMPAVGSNFLVVRPDQTGEALVDQRMRVVLPQAMLRLCGLGAGRRVLLVATGGDGVLVVHPLVNCAQMVRQFHGQGVGASAVNDVVPHGD